MLRILQAIDRKLQPADKLVAHGIARLIERPLLTPFVVTSGALMVRGLCDRMDRLSSERTQAEIAQRIAESGIIAKTVELKSSEVI